MNEREFDPLNYDNLGELKQAHQEQPFSKPIYVGKADPAGVRTGKRDKTKIGQKLADRLNQHAGSLRAVSATLTIDDFWCRYLVLEPTWIGLGEATAISITNPLWNVVVDGFGNHAPGGGRDKGKKPRWDTLHEGRAWAKKLPGHKEDEAAIIARIAAFFHGDISARLPDDMQDTEATSDAQEQP